MSQNASLTIGGPCIVTHNGAVYYTDDKGVKTKTTKELKRRSVGGFGSIPPSIVDVKTEISFTPVQYKNTDKMFPYFAKAMGTRIFGDADLPVAVQSMTESKKWTWSRGAVTKSPKLGLGPKKDTLGEMTITSLKGNATELSGASSIVAVAASNYTDASFDITKLFDLKYIATWGEAPFDAIEPEDGFDVDTDYDLKPLMMNGQVVDMKLGDVRTKASFKPVNLTHANLLTLMRLQGAGMDTGTRLGPALCNDLYILSVQGEDTDPAIILVKAYVTDVGTMGDGENHFADVFTFEASRTFSSGAAQQIAVVNTLSEI